MKIKCKNKRCMESNNGKPYEWDYQGQSPFYATCPRCRTTIKIERKEAGKINRSIAVKIHNELSCKKKPKEDNK